jgi:predicted metal-binding membrane protein
MLQSRGPQVGALLLLVAGIYQLTAFKRACLDRCRSPAQFIVQHMRPGLSGALRLGLLHGAYCVGCCAGLMLLLFFGGVMSLLWIAAISLFVLLEKLAPFGAGGGRLSGVLLLCGAILIGSGLS